MKLINSENLKIKSAIVLLALTINGCELFYIGERNKETVEIGRNSALGAVYLFKMELDSNNVWGAADAFAHPGGTRLRAMEKYEMMDEIARVGRIIGSAPVTYVREDSVSASSARVLMQFDYIRAVSFSTAKIEDDWHIVGYRFVESLR